MAAIGCFPDHNCPSFYWLPVCGLNLLLSPFPKEASQTQSGQVLLRLWLKQEGGCVTTWQGLRTVPTEEVNRLPGSWGKGSLLDSAPPRTFSHSTERVLVGFIGHPAHHVWHAHALLVWGVWSHGVPFWVR